MQVLDICIHAPKSVKQLEPPEELETHKIYQKSECVKVIYDIPNVGEYIQRELGDLKQSTAVTSKYYCATKIIS